MSYDKPVLRALDLETGAACCNFWFGRCSGIGGPDLVLLSTGADCVSVTPLESPTLDPNAVTLTPVLTNTIVGVDDGSVRVTPLANTGLPLTQPIQVGVPVETRGIHADVSLLRAEYAIDRSGFGATVAGNSVLLGLP